MRPGGGLDFFKMNMDLRIRTIDSVPEKDIVAIGRSAKSKGDLLENLFYDLKQMAELPCEIDFDKAGSLFAYKILARLPEK